MIVESASSPRLGPATRLGAVELTVTDLDRSVSFYDRAIGLRVHRRDRDLAALGAGGADLLVLVARPDANPAGRHAGLYHFALLHPSRLELARAALRLAATETPIGGASDHLISEAIYLADPDGIGIELAADRPREAWPDLRDPNTYAHGPQPLDLRGLLGLVADEEPSPHANEALTVGHVHLHVGDLKAATRFYCDVLGFELISNLPGACFVAAGGYHHHVGLNVWRGEGVPPAPPNAVGLRHFTVVLESATELASVRERLADAHEHDGGFFVRDPAGNGIVLRAAG